MHFSHSKNFIFNNTTWSYYLLLLGSTFEHESPLTFSEISKCKAQSNENIVNCRFNNWIIPQSVKRNKNSAFKIPINVIGVFLGILNHSLIQPSQKPISLLVNRLFLHITDTTNHEQRTIYRNLRNLNLEPKQNTRDTRNVPNITVLSKKTKTKTINT